MSREAEPMALRATITGVALTYACPACEVEIDSLIAAEPSDWGGFAVPLEERFDICSHCGALLDFGATLMQEAA